MSSHHNTPDGADDLVQRFAARQLEMAAAELARDAERLAVAARQYADDIAAGRHAAHTGWPRMLPRWR